MISLELYVAERAVVERVPQVLPEARAKRQVRRRVYLGPLAWLGHRLVAWGWSLQERYNDAGPGPAPRSANRAVN